MILDKERSSPGSEAPSCGGADFANPWEWSVYEFFGVRSFVLAFPSGWFLVACHGQVGEQAT